MAPAVLCTDQLVGLSEDDNGVGLCQDAQTIELTLDGVPYELQAYRIDEEQFAAEWRCKDCDETDGVLIRASSLDDALDFAAFQFGRSSSVCTSRDVGHVFNSNKPTQISRDPKDH